MPRLTVGISTAPPAIASTTTVAGRPAEVSDTFTRIGLPPDYVAIAEQSSLSAYAFYHTAVAASVKLAADNADPIR